MKNPNPIHPLIGPHEGRELELMLQGEKPAAMFYDIEPYTEGIIPEDEFQPYVDAGKIVKKETFHVFRDAQVRHVYYARPDYSANIDRLIEITKHQYDSERKTSWPEELERETGKLLGYSDEAIEYYLDHRRIQRAHT